MCALDAMDLDRRVLLTAPWCWPPPQSRARELLLETLDAVPALPAGRTPVLTIRGDTTTLWCLDVNGTSAEMPYRDAPGFSRVPLGPAARRAWQAAALALPRAVPVLWRPTHYAAGELPVATFLRSHLDVPGFEERDRELDGPSFGLAFFLALASHTLDLPLPDDAMALAAIDERGRLLPIDSLAVKITGLMAMAPSICRVMVCRDQAQAARAAAAGRLDVLDATSGGEALEVLWGDALSNALVDAGVDAERRAELVDAFFRLTLVGRGVTINWAPLERGAAMALREWPLADDQEHRLQFAWAVAARHERHPAELPLPEEMSAAGAWLDRQPAPVRLAILTKLVRQSADAGTPPWPKTEALALRALPTRFEDALLPHLNLMGALARLWAVTGREVSALVLVRRLARACAEAFAEQELWLPLAEVFRLSGVLRDRVAYEDADDLRAHTLTLGGLGPQDLPHVDLARARALVLFGRLDDAALERLHTLTRDPEAPYYVRWSASRWLVRALREHRHDEAADQQLARLEQETHGRTRRHRTAEPYLVLARLDAALVAGETTRAANLVAHLAELDPGPVGHLLAVSTDPDYIASRYPD